MRVLMRKEFFSWMIVLLIGLVLFPVCTSGANEPKEVRGLWEIAVQTQVEQPVRMAAFLNENFGVTGGFSGAGKAHVTLDGGNTWTKSESSGGCLYGIEIVNSQFVWVCGRVTGQSFSTPGGIRLSSDGGQTFGPKTTLSTYPEECPMSFIDGRTGLIFQPDAKTLSATTDGGQTWENVTLPANAKKIKAVGIRSADAGYVLDDSGVIYATENKGRSWVPIKLPMKKYPKYRMLFVESASAAIRSFDKNSILVVMSLAGGKEPCVIAFRTHDAGATWQNEYVGAAIGSIYLSPDGRFITSNLGGKLTVYRYTGNEEGK